MTRETAVKKMMNFLKTFSTSFLSLLSKTREKDQEMKILRMFFKEVENVVRENLEKFQTDYLNIIVQVEKVV